MSDWLAAGGNADALRKLIAEAKPWQPSKDAVVAAARPSASKPVIELRAGALDEVATQAEVALVNADAQLYHSSGAIVRPIIEYVKAFQGRKTKVARLRPSAST